MLVTLIVTSTLYLGDIKREWIDIVLRTDGNHILGATFRPYQKTVRLVTGTANKNHVVLREWSSRGVQSATIDARVTSKGLRGMWNHAPFDFWPGFFPDSPLLHGYWWPVFDQLHDEIVTGRWDDALFQAQLGCALKEQECEWLPVVQKRQLPAQFPPCDFQHRMGCLFARDAIYKLPFNERKAPARPLCDHYRLACGEAWGATELELCDAALRGDAAKVEELLRRKPNVNAGDGALMQPLPAAVQAKSLPVVKLLIEHGADPNTVPLELAIANNEDEIVLYLLDHGAKLDYVLANAADHRRRAIAMKALEKGANVDETGPAGTALTAAVDRRDVAMVRLLLAHCANPEIATRHSDGSPIDHARKLGAKKILKMLLAARKAPCSHPSP